MSATIIQDEIVHFEVLGRGRPIIFIHGWIGSWRYWVPTMQATSIAYRSYALDLWGFGETAKAPERYTLENQVQLLDGFLDALGIGKIAIIGHGLGAVIGLMYATRQPDYVDRVMAIGFPMSNVHINERLKVSSPNQLGEWLLNNVPGRDAAAQEITKLDPAAVRASVDGMEDLDFKQLAFELPIPCLYVHGENDPLVNNPSFETITELSEQTHSIRFENAGHFPMLHEPNKFNRLLADFLALNPGESPRQLQLKEEWKRRVR
jgi:pimeloyl-ACP methyl ester carboxylesterase